MANKKHHTKRLLNARKKALKKWKRGLISEIKDTQIGSIEPTHEEISVFCAGFNMGYKVGRIHERISPPPQKQINKTAVI